MNETIGVKGGKNDRLRRLRITKKQKEKLKQEQLDEETKELEKKVKKIQILSLIGVIPVAAIGQTIKTLYEDENKERLKELNDLKEEINHSQSIEEKEKLIKALEANYLVGTLPKEVREKIGVEYKDIYQELRERPHDQATILSNFLEEYQEDEKHSIKSTSTTQEDELTDPFTVQLAQIKSQKLVEEYEKQLKDIRSDLRKLSFEYGVLEKESNSIYQSKEAETLLDRLNYIIKKIEELKYKISKEELSKYDDNYLYALIEKYLTDFKTGKISDEIKDSMLFILIAEKLAELDEKKDELKQKITDRKTTLQVDEAKLETLKEEYFNYDKFNAELLKFQNEQDHLLNEIREKMKNATRIEEKVEIEVKALSFQSAKLMALSRLQMILPGARSAKGLATATATYLYFMKNVLNPETTTKRYKVIKVDDYSKQIESSINSLDSILKNVSKTSSKLRMMIKDFEIRYKEYFEKLPECKQLLNNLYHVERQLEEKEYELKKIKREQELALEKNNLKVKMLDNKKIA